MNKIIKIFIGVICVGVSAYALWEAPISVVENNTPLAKSSVINNSKMTEALELNGMSDAQNFIATLTQRMKQQHSHDIALVLVQLSMADFQKFVLEEFPVEGQEIFQTIMRDAFPEFAEAIFTLLENMHQYNDWHVDMLLTLNDMDSLTRNGTLWEKRRALFGDLADEIWQQELDENEAKQKSVQETLAVLQVATDISMLDRLYILKDSIQQQYGDEHSNMLISKGMVADIYFHLDSVQADLKKMSEQDRASALAESRRQLGFSDENIQEMAERDEEKESRWKNGYEYMTARDQLTNLYEGADLSEKLMELRVTFFEHEAPTIEKEEQAEFFRYKRPRLYGSN